MRGLEIHYGTLIVHQWVRELMHGQRLAEPPEFGGEMNLLNARDQYYI